MAGTDIFSKKHKHTHNKHIQKIFYVRCPNQVVSIGGLLKHLFVIEKLRLIGLISFGFARNKILDFQNTVVELSSTNATKIILLTANLSLQSDSVPKMAISDG